LIGLLEDFDLAVGSGFRNPGDDIILLGNFSPSFGGSEYMSRIFGLNEGDSPDIDPEGELKLIRLMNRLASLRLVNSAHDLSDGGLAVALAECCISGKIEELGCKVEFAGNAVRKDLRLFGESQGCIIISCAGNDSEKVIRTAGDMGVNSALIGKTTSSSEIEIDGLIKLNSSKAREAYYCSIPGLMRSDHQQP
jgi:phosphoribosylformylglycinamidine synthase